MLIPWEAYSPKGGRKQIIKYKEPLIYAYKRKSNNKIVYVGQTIDLRTRHKTHIQYDPYNPNTLEYNYPLSRGIRKHGQDEYELVILEESVSIEDLDNKEIYYIKLYDTYKNGYNQNKGGGINGNFYIYEEAKIEQSFDLLRNSNFSYPQISDMTGLSITHLYNLNYGLRRRKDDITYPLRGEDYLTRGQKLTSDEVKQIKYTLKNTKVSIRKIEEMYNCKSISGINRGRLFFDENESYPLRGRCGINEGNDLDNLIEELLNSTIPFKNLGKKYNISQDVVSNINRGITYKKDTINYPIRRNKL